MLSLSDAIVAELRSEMRTPHVTYDTLAERTSVPRRTLIRHLTGETPMTFAVAEKVADALGVSMDELFTRAKMRQRRPERLVIEEGGALGDPSDTLPASPSPVPLPSPRRTARRGSAGRADS